MESTQNNAYVTKAELAQQETRLVDRIAQLERRMFVFGLGLAGIIIAAVKYLS